jgi:hypothetical protein
MKKANLKKAIELMKRKPVNPVGECFDHAIHQLLAPGDAPSSARLCHGIGVANMPGQEGNRMAHAWVEFVDNAGRKLAIDTTWGMIQPAYKYRKDGRLDYVVEYTVEQARLLWEINNMPGPWDPAIRAVADGKEKNNNG